jgi:N,N'-diacetyllegionaminate synthase
MDPAGTEHEDTASVFVIAEIGSNHNNDFELAATMIRHAAKGGARAAKFQTFSADGLYSVQAPRLTEMANFNGVDASETPHSLAAKLEMDREWIPRLADLCEQQGIEFMSTPFDLEAVGVIDPFVRRHKIASFDVDNKELIERVAACGKPVILSTGHSYLGEIERALSWIEEVDPNISVTLLQCTNQYPTDPHDVHLNAMTTVASTFGVDIGLSDHTMDNVVSFAAVALGARTLERHVTEDRNLPGPDHRFALEPPMLAELVDGSNRILQALGSSRKVPTAAEAENRRLARRSVHASDALSAGHVLRREDLLVVRPALGIPPYEVDVVVGKQLRSDVTAGQPLQWADLG